MTAGIEKTDRTFSVREMPWMGLMDGQVNVLPEYPTRAEAQALVHPWEPISEHLYRKVPVITPEGELREEFEEVPTLGNFRSDITGAAGYLGPISPTLVTVTNNELWDVAEAIQDVPQGDVMYETGGSLNGGKRVWIALRLKEPLFVNGDPNGTAVPFYVLQNNHAGEGAFRGQATVIRPVCSNTIQQADVDSKARGTEFNFSHTKNVRDRIEEARQALAGWRESLESYQRLAELMITERVTAQGEREFLERFIPAPPSSMTSDRVKGNIEAAREQWMGVYNSPTCEGIQGTAWGLLQASSEWSEHVRRANSAETRFKRALLDRNHILTDAKELALEAAHA